MKLEFSAGGVVLRQAQDFGLKPPFEKKDWYVLLAQHSQHHGWVFPKGLIDAGESQKQAAVREVEEETGVQATIKKPLEPVTYWYQFQGEKRKKTVYYFLMEYIAEDVTKKDDEMETVEWIPADTVEQKLTYPSDKKVWQEARELIAHGV